MPSKRIFMTGASGCIGHYIADLLIHQTDHDLFLFVRDPQKLKFDYNARPGITLIQGDMQEIERVGRLLKTVNCAILAATSWGGAQETHDTNVTKTLRLMNLLDPINCEQVLYFSTSSILNQQNQPLPEAETYGTDYIKSKYLCHQQIPKLAIAPQVTTLFPTLVFGGNSQKPYSAISAGIQDVTRWIDIIRFLKADASFHFLHAQDIAQVVLHLIEFPPDPGPNHEIVLGNPALTVNQAVEQVCAYLGKRIFFRIPLSIPLANLIIKLFRIQMADWDRFCLSYRHFTYQTPVSPASFDLPALCPTVADLLNASGIQQHKSMSK
ncbi:MAG: NAD(P)-dependent oxidoreductase [Pegethrix bostrychoides GSE-TBD4-15B]|jgi:nucleoside-diphosphate-sugar epimerase|uniref:NAD(P)-dependent oxidoreductase n=1 Tax=Pegethrix bostrychoides GSE-TBD4-15B TaxID=2839662 RepID=A0A951PF91_9CYAN|nr:NAD(P)-dependent oxidoreductase [Pegethrix bostrychoides GSE-TBD4-15B]